MRFFAALILLVSPVAAQAEWLEVSSDHFVIYADDREADARLFAERMELFHAAMAWVTKSEGVKPSPSNRVTIYVVKNVKEVQRIFGDGGSNIGGFYIPRAGGSLAIVPSVDVRGRELSYSMVTLLHEYAHHFLTSTSNFPQPRWLGEGGAEFYASAEFPADGGISVGRPAQHRAGEFMWERDVKAAELLDPETFEKKHKGQLDSFYAKSWLLYHYLVFSDERRGQLQNYLRELYKGAALKDAGQTAFGDPVQLERELDKYLKERKLYALKLKRDGLAVGPIAVKRLSEGHAAVMPFIVRSKRGVDAEQAAQLVEEVRPVAASYPQDPVVLAELAEAEYDSGNLDAAIAAADAALAIDGSLVNAHVQKGYALFRKALDADDREVAAKAAERAFIALNKLENDHPIPLVYYYRGFGLRGQASSEIAVRGLEKAAELAPFDLSLRMEVAMSQLFDGKYDQARRNLAPVAYNPHAAGGPNVARDLIELIDSEHTPSRERIVEVMNASRAGSAGGADAGPSE